MSDYDCYGCEQCGNPHAEVNTHQICRECENELTETVSFDQPIIDFLRKGGKIEEAVSRFKLSKKTIDLIVWEERFRGVKHE